ncbi:MAG: MFS transporter [Hespellia sp.]|nr:MFS transporter [Hespellia sp.]
MNKNTDRISLKEKLSFGMGDFATNGVFTFISSYLLYFYTDCARISLKSAGIILLTGRIVDALACLSAGNIVDRTNTKIGKCRPFLAVCYFPMIFLMCLMFWIPEIGHVGKLCFGIVTYVIFSILYAFVNVPYSTMLSVITNDNKQRISLNIFKNFGGNAGALFVTMLSLFLVNILGGQNNNAYLKVSVLYGIVFLICAYACVIHTRERVKKESGEEVNVRHSFKIARKNKNWMVFIAIQMIDMLYMILHNQGTFYYAKYYLENEVLSTVFLSMTPLFCVACSLGLPLLAKRIDLKYIMMSGHMVVFLSLIGTALVGKNVWGTLICAVFTSMGWAMATGMIFVMLSQLIDWSERESGSRIQGFMTSCMTFLMKLGIAAAGFLGPQILKAGGYVADQAAGAQTIFAIKANYIYVPAILALVVILLTFQYHLDEEGREYDSREKESSHLQLR